MSFSQAMLKDFFGFLLDGQNNQEPILKTLVDYRESRGDEVKEVLDVIIKDF